MMFIHKECDCGQQATIQITSQELEAIHKGGHVLHAIGHAHPLLRLVGKTALVGFSLFKLAGKHSYYCKSCKKSFEA